MKAWLKKRGATYSELKNLGHDLERIMAVSYEKYHLLFDAKSQAKIKMVNRHYSSKDFEYFLMSTKTVPEITELASTVKLLISKARFDILLDGDPRKLKSLG